MKETNSPIAAAFVQVQAKIHNPPLDGRNPHFKSKFATLGATLKVIRPVCAEHGLAFWQEPVVQDDKVGVRTYLVHEAGEVKIFEPLFIKGPKADAHGQGSALTYARRYALCAIFGIVGDDDDDGNAAVAGQPDVQDVISDAQLADLMAKIEEVGADLPKFLKYLGVDSLADLGQQGYKRALASLEAKAKKGAN